MQRRKQAPKQTTEQTCKVPTIVSFAFLSVSLADTQRTSILARFAAAMRSPYEQQELWKLAELFFQRDLGCFGRVLKVHGDLQPTASYLILAPRVQLFPDVLSAAKEFMTACPSLQTLQVQLQIGRTFVLDKTGHELHKLALSCSAHVS
jgi:hypothetical protein